ncbi:DNA-binding transcriptional MerR regulator [Sphingobium sp. B2D3A]|uniref:MerR family transcriptional regulator n=1 Tax=Sphingobium TaxID=165695 RepID=UPI0015EBC27B|nr:MULTISPECIES: MerR family DNA-binding transcriptional regulator [Sphingobium]MCW2338782.1 DNA-binding transcriptional MerR regulator [Sphingobium sp. B2D3A]MCW2338813.1 DNA-binding transcriptional MerR regulator [Sphingobium sp. B2D3A]MCW2349749.1 DNA-binding transcriptional MerR regulator [Sphingobium sp. B12D2B]MCW2364403.1 DNA-binding transcriptional MerR regulator [Sphingobium sp. B10D3B]MCW2367091.1 DNA-binding transcriptional MerR regulator [Sphingobium sp. B7D2B]
MTKLQMIAGIPQPERDGREEFSISDLCDEFEVTPRALRFYEDEELISPRRQGLTRVYSHRDRARLAWILRGKRVGFSLAEIRDMIDLYDAGDGRRTQREFTVAKCEERIGLLQRQRQDIDEAIEELKNFVALVEENQRLSGELN